MAWGQATLSLPYPTLQHSARAPGDCSGVAGELDAALAASEPARSDPARPPDRGRERGRPSAPPPPRKQPEAAAEPAGDSGREEPSSSLLWMSIAMLATDTCRPARAGLARRSRSRQHNLCPACCRLTCPAQRHTGTCGSRAHFAKSTQICGRRHAAHFTSFAVSMSKKSQQKAETLQGVEQGARARRLGRKVGGVGRRVQRGDEGRLGARQVGPVQAGKPGVQLHLRGRRPRLGAPRLVARSGESVRVVRDGAPGPARPRQRPPSGASRTGMAHAAHVTPCTFSWALYESVAPPGGARVCLAPGRNTAPHDTAGFLRHERCKCMRMPDGGREAPASSTLPRQAGAARGAAARLAGAARPQALRRVGLQQAIDQVAAGVRQGALAVRPLDAPVQDVVEDVLRGNGGTALQ